MRYDSPQANNAHGNTTESIESAGIPADDQNCTAIQDEVGSGPNFITGEAVVLESVPAIRKPRPLVRSKPKALVYTVAIHEFMVNVDGP